MDKKRVYTFGNGQAEGKADMRNLLDVYKRQEERCQENDLSDGMETGRSSRWPGGDFDGNTRRDATLYEKITK